MVEEAPAEKKAWDGQEPKRFALDSRVTGRVVASSVTLALRLGSGALTAGWKGFGLGDASGAEGYTFTTLPGNRILTEQTDVTSFARPAEPIKLYEFEGCPFCKKVREACAYLDISAEFYPCPRGSPNYRPFVEKEGGKAQFPYMIDPNQNVSMYESDDIIKHLFNNYGPGEDAIPGTLSGSPLNAISAGLSLLPRAGAGSTYRSAKTPELLGGSTKRRDASFRHMSAVVGASASPDARVFAAPRRAAAAPPRTARPRMLRMCE